MIKLGDKVRDSISGFEGIVLGITSWLHGCDRACVAPEALHEGKPIQNQHFDVNQLKLLKEQREEPTREHDPKPGGPQDDPGSARSGE